MDAHLTPPPLPPPLRLRHDSLCRLFFVSFYSWWTERLEKRLADWYRRRSVLRELIFDAERSDEEKEEGAASWGGAQEDGAAVAAAMVAVAAVEQQEKAGGGRAKSKGGSHKKGAAAAAKAAAAAAATTEAAAAAAAVAPNGWNQGVSRSTFGGHSIPGGLPVENATRGGGSGGAGAGVVLNGRKTEVGAGGSKAAGRLLRAADDAKQLQFGRVAKLTNGKVAGSNGTGGGVEECKGGTGDEKAGAGAGAAMVAAARRPQGGVAVGAGGKVVGTKEKEEEADTFMVRESAGRV